MAVDGPFFAVQIIRRSSTVEKVLCLVKHRRGHRCGSAWIVVVTVAWEGVHLADADVLYDQLVSRLNKCGIVTERRCATNADRTCACQGLDPDTCGVSYSFGCAWSVFHSGCKFARSQKARKFRLNDPSEVVTRVIPLSEFIHYSFGPAGSFHRAAHEQFRLRHRHHVGPHRTGSLRQSDGR